MMIRRSRGLLLRSPSEIGAGKNGKEEAAGRSEEEVMLGTMDIKDAFLQVPPGGAPET